MKSSSVSTQCSQAPARAAAVMRARQIGEVRHVPDGRARPGDRRFRRTQRVGTLAVARRVDGIVREAIHVDDAWSREDVLVADAAEHPRQRRHHLQLARRARREVCMPSFRLPGNQQPVDVEQHAFAEPRAGRNHRDVAGRHALALLKHRQLVSLENRDAVRHRLEIVEQPHPAEVRTRGEVGRIDAPRDVGQLGHLVGDRAGDAERCRLDLAGGHAVALQEALEDRLEVIVLERGELLGGNRCWPVLVRLEQAEQRLGAADISCEKHEVIVFRRSVVRRSVGRGPDEVGRYIRAKRPALRANATTFTRMARSAIVSDHGPRTHGTWA